MDTEKRVIIFHRHRQQEKHTLFHNEIKSNSQSKFLSVDGEVLSSVDDIWSAGETRARWKNLFHYGDTRRSDQSERKRKKHKS
jgi:hypothetical protein